MRLRVATEEAAEGLTFRFQHRIESVDKNATLGADGLELVLATAESRTKCIRRDSVCRVGGRIVLRLLLRFLWSEAAIHALSRWALSLAFIILWNARRMWIMLRDGIEHSEFLEASPPIRVED